MSYVMQQPGMSPGYGQPMMMGSQQMMMQQPMMATQQAVPNFEYVTSGGGVIAPSGGMDYQSGSGSYYFQPNTPFVFYPTDNAPAVSPKRDVKVAKKKAKKKSCGCC